MDSRWEPATSPVARVWLVNGATLPATGVYAGRADAAAGPPAAPMVMPAIAAVAPTAAMSVLALDMVPLS
jgi:hypothetical protein